MVHGADEDLLTALLLAFTAAAGGLFRTIAIAVMAILSATVAVTVLSAAIVLELASLGALSRRLLGRSGLPWRCLR
jgi:hypothetical protein